jgi:hypothetical protein
MVDPAKQFAALDERRRFAGRSPDDLSVLPNSEARLHYGDVERLQRFVFSPHERAS